MTSQKEPEMVDLRSTSPVDYHRYVRSKHWSRSKGQRKRSFLPVITVEGFKLQIVPAQAEAVLAGERLAHSPTHNKRGRPRRDERRRPQGPAR
jgi:hypothetical protein